MLLRALVDISSTVGVISKGSKFYELNPTQAGEMIKLGQAESLEPEIKADTSVVVKPQEPLAAPVRIGPNSRGWDGLLWDGATVVVIGSGPSLTIEQTQAVRDWRWGGDTVATDRKVIVINTSFRLAPWADVLYACDSVWWNAKEPGSKTTYYEEALTLFNKDSLWTQDRGAANELGLRYVQSVNARGLSKKPGVIHQGNNSGYQAVNLAYIAGAKRIILLGFDMRGSHWHGDHPPPLSSTLPHITWINNFSPLARELKDAGIEVLNATPKSALKYFPMVTLDEVLK